MFLVRDVLTYYDLGVVGRGTGLFQAHLFCLLFRYSVMKMCVGVPWLPRLFVPPKSRRFSP